MKKLHLLIFIAALAMTACKDKSQNTTQDNQANTTLQPERIELDEDLFDKENKYANVRISIQIADEDDDKTPVATATFKHLAGKKLAIVPILRAGLGMVDGILDLIPSAKVGHIGLYRAPETHAPVEYYCKMPNDIAERDVIILDPMLATGGSAAAAITFIKGYGCKHIKLMNVIAAPEGIACIQKEHPDVDIYVAAVDEKLNDHAYIVPGLGDAGDRIFGTK